VLADGREHVFEVALVVDLTVDLSALNHMLTPLGGSPRATQRPRRCPGPFATSKDRTPRAPFGSASAQIHHIPAAATDASPMRGTTACSSIDSCRYNCPDLSSPAGPRTVAHAAALFGAGVPGRCKRLCTARTPGTA